LPALTQEKLTKNLAKGRQALSFGDINGALFYFAKGYELHPRNPDIMNSLDKLVDRMLINMRAKPTEQERSQYLIQLTELLKYSALSQHSKLLRKQKELQENR
jgi:hypothetical protein